MLIYAANLFSYCISIHSIIVVYLVNLVFGYRISSVIRQSFLGRVKLVIHQNFIGLIWLFEVILEGQKPVL